MASSFGDDFFDADLLRHRRGYLLLEWIRQAEQDAPKPMQGFAGFRRQNLHAAPPDPHPHSAMTFTELPSEPFS
ncbi:hypothetical protein OH768_53310 [Streptomyces sp. NBC_01622]|uniref:hypothetical protein n=1 Tax=Streptomyces sp. NBC_01622 TaxID=2975903 RepID=UPI00386BB076|nr:hypothetical protein OH768_53310 [Streptomyces sp. NBC_01622]